MGAITWAVPVALVIGFIAGAWFLSFVIRMKLQERRGPRVR